MMQKLRLEFEGVKELSENSCTFHIVVTPLNAVDDTCERTFRFVFHSLFGELALKVNREYKIFT